MIITDRHEIIYKGSEFMDKFKLEIYNDPSILDHIKDEWDRLLKRTYSHSLFQTPIWNSIWWSHFSNGLEIFIIVMRDQEGFLRGIAPLYLQKKDGVKRVAQFIGGLELSDYLDFVVEVGKERHFFESIKNYFKKMSNRFELDLHFIPESSQFLGGNNPFFDDQAISIEIIKEEVSPSIKLPYNWDEYLKGLRQKDRHELLRKMRRAESGGSLNYYMTDRPEALERDIMTFCELHRKSKEAKRGFMTPKMCNFFKELAMILFSEGKLFLNFLYINGRAVASIFAIRYGRGISLYNSGFDPEFAHISPGIVLIGHAIKEAIEEGCIFFDFLRGGESYKYRFGASDKWLYNVKITFNEMVSP
jgi:CelD/BcsL family acetyltransferase involved in cellulose biosynthesis